jgi:hypothetical protein
VQKLAAQPVATQNTPAGLAIPIMPNDLSVQVAEIEPSVVQASNAQASVSQPADDQSTFTAVQTPLAGSEKTQSASTVAASPIRWKVSSTGLAESHAVAAQAGNVAASNSQPAAFQSMFTALQRPLAVPATTQSDSTGLASLPIRNVPVAGWSETEAGLTSTSTFQFADIQLNSSPAQTPRANSATTQNTSTVATSEPTRNVPAAGWNETEPNVVSTNTLSASISQPSAAQSSFTSVKKPLVDSIATENTMTGAAVQVPENVWATKLAGTQSNATQSSITSTSISQPAVLQSKLTPSQTPLTDSATTQNASAVAASQVPQNVSATELAGNQSIDAQAIIASTSISQPVVVESKVIPVHTPLAASATTQDTSTVAASRPAQTVLAAAGKITELSIDSTNIEPTAVQSSVAPLQMPFAGAAMTQSAPTVTASRPTQNVTAARWDEIEMNFTSTTIPQTSEPQAAVLQSTVSPTQIPFVNSETVQETSNGLAAQTTQIVPAAELMDSQSSIARTSIAQTSVAQETVVQPAGVSSSVSPLSKDSSQNSSKLSATRVQEMTAPITASPKSGNGDPSAVAATVSQAAPATDSNAVQDSLPKAALSVLSDAVQSTVANDPVEINQVPVVRAALIASATDVVASASKTGATVHTDSQPVAADQASAANTISVPNAIVDQLASLPLYDGSLGRIQTIVSSLKPVSAAKPQANASAADKGSSTDQAGLKKNAEPVSGAGSRSSSQDATQSGNQSQGGSTPQAQDAAPLPINFSSHSAAVIAPEQNTGAAASHHTSLTPTGTDGVGARTTDNSTARASIALPQSQPVINTAKLIQSMGQSEMRVGMRSNEFGSIQISTSTTRDVVSAQISLEHGELAKTLAAHLPEMQARLGGNQPADVRIDMNGSATGQGTGSFGGTSNDSAGQSRSGRQQGGSMAQGQSGSRVAEQQFSSVAAAVPTGYARLDIRV